MAGTHILDGGDVADQNSGPDPSFGVTLKGFSAGFKVFGRYVLKRVLGRGGMGVVWLARDEQLERDVAIKFLPELVVLDREAIDELKRETRRSLELTHPHIVRIYDFEQDEQTAGISMEYIDGKTLSALKIDQPGRCLGASQIKPWIEQLCGALDYAHTKARVIHRDLKPANLMITSQGDVKISDFGISCSISDSVSRISMVRGTSGTPVFMSPQQALGEKPTVQDDIYALGASIYDLLSGKPPFYSGDILTQLREISPPPISRRREDLGNSGEPIPPDWERTVMACLSKEPSRRPNSAGEVARMLGLGSVAATSVGREARSKNAAPPAKGRSWISLLAGACVIGAIAAIGLVAFNARRSAVVQEQINRRNAEEASRLISQREAAKAKEEPPAAAPAPTAQASPPPVPRGRAPETQVPKTTTPPPPPTTIVEKKESAPAPQTAPSPMAPPPEPPAPKEEAGPSPKAISQKAKVPPPLPEPEKFKLHPPEQDSMSTLPVLVYFAKDPTTSDKPSILKRIDRVITAYHLSQPEIKAVHVERWRAAIDASAELGSIPACVLLSEGLAESDPVVAFKAGLKAAQAGNTRAMLDTGRRFRDGRGTQPSPAEARRWLQSAADGGEAEARRVLAYALLQGIGMASDPPAAVEMFRVLSDAGDPVAMDLLGTFYHKGLHGLARDPERAFRLYTGASELGHLGALANLGVLYIKGEGTAAEPSKAASLFKKGAEAGNARCMELLAVCLEEGIGVEKDAATAEQWRRKAAATAKAE